jgi:hypothetical protein
MRKSKECKERDRQIPEEACCHHGKERKEVLRISEASEEEDPGSMPGISATSEEEDPVSMPGISVATEEERGRPGFHTWDLRQRDDGGVRRRIWVQDRRSQW